MPQIKERQLPGDQSRDPSIIELLTYNEPTGGRKAVNLGPSLLPMNDGAGGFTTDASTKRILNAGGLGLYIYNSDTVVHAATAGDSTMVAQAAGAVQTAGSPTAPFVGIPCPPGIWTWFGMGKWNQIQTDSNKLMVFVIEDPTYMVVQPANNSSTQLLPQGPGNT